MRLPLLEQKVELILLLILWHFIIGLGKAVLLVLFICTLILLPFVRSLHPPPQPTMHTCILLLLYYELLLCVHVCSFHLFLYVDFS